MTVGEIISLITLLAGAVLGLSAMFSPAWASRIVRLVEDPDPLRPGGYSEFRATYGGLFLFSHLMTAILVVNLGNSDPEILTSLVVLPLAAGWVGAGVGPPVLALSTWESRGMHCFDAATRGGRRCCSGGCGC